MTPDSPENAHLWSLNYSILLASKLMVKCFAGNFEEFPLDSGRIVFWLGFHISWHILGDRLIPLYSSFEFSGILHVTH